MSDIQTSTVAPRELHPRRAVRGALTLPGDKSISHRAALLGLWTAAPLTITNYSDGEDCARSLAAVEALGATVRRGDAGITITAPERYPTEPVSIDCGNSGTTARLLIGLLSGMERAVELVGDISLSQRPMKRVTEPLRQMGARFSEQSETLPLTVFGGASGSLDYRLPIPSAQVKSAILLAALTGGGRAIVTEDVLTRDHTERMALALGGQCEIRKPRVEIQDDPADPRKKNRVILDDWKSQVIVHGGERLDGGVIDIPGDPSTAAFYLAAAAISKGEVTITNHSLNPTRVAFLEHLRAIGCEVEITAKSVVSEEPRG
ncbi:MAG TPA: hypothetical protein VLB27_06645, partial [candidate division Zixibacteria bacterium]|nr:hypothetical protein [candidate division Zixibacteria bacterium]